MQPAAGIALEDHPQVGLQDAHLLDRVVSTGTPRGRAGVVEQCAQAQLARLDRPGKRHNALRVGGVAEH